MATDLIRDWEGREVYALEPEVRKPCLLLDGSDHLRSGKGRVASSAEISVRLRKSSVVNYLITKSVNFRTPSIFCIGDRGRFVFCCPIHRLYPFRQFPLRKLIQSVEIQTV